MARKPTRAELESSVQRWTDMALLCAWAIRQGRQLAKDSYDTIERPRSGPIVVRTDEHGVPQYGIEPGDNGAQQRELTGLHHDAELYDACLSTFAKAKHRLARDVCPYCGRDPKSSLCQNAHS